MPLVMNLAPTIGVLLLAVAVLAGVSFLVARQTSDSPRKAQPPRKKRDRESLIREANKRLAQNPKDEKALSQLADLYYSEENWDKAYRSYGALLELVPASSDLDELTISLRHALAALHLGKHEEAYKGLMIAKGMRSDMFEINFNLGKLEFKRKQYERAAALLKSAAEQHPDHLETNRYLAHSLYRLQNHQAALSAIRKVTDQDPGDKEALFLMGQCYFELAQTDQALRLFSHLLGDPTYGPGAALRAGSIYLKRGEVESAQADFEIGLRHERMKPEIKLELQYRLALAYAQLGRMNDALSLYQQIHQVNPDYKDVASRITTAKELTSNQKLQTYLLAPASDFIALCRNMVLRFFPRSKTRIVDVRMQGNEYADILAEVDTAKWQDVILFRFVRSEGKIGELMLRDLHQQIKDIRAGRGFCICAGSFTDGAKAFVEARLIDLLAKEELNKLLGKVDVTTM